MTDKLKEHIDAMLKVEAGYEYPPRLAEDIYNKIKWLEDERSTLIEALKASASGHNKLIEENKTLETSMKLLLVALKRAEEDFYTASNRFRDEDYIGPVEGINVNVVCHIDKYYELHMEHLKQSAKRIRDISN